MFSFKEIKKVIAAAVVLSAIAVYASPSFALEVNCDGKTGQELKNCEELKALAEKGNKKAEETAKKAQEKATDKGADAIKEKWNYKNNYDGGKKDEYGFTAAAAKGGDLGEDDSQARIEAANKKKQEASAALSKALAEGRSKDAEAAQQAMIAANNDISNAQADAKRYKEAQKAQEKADKEAQKAKEKAEKAQAKADAKVVKAAEKNEKNANKDKAKADKEVKKLQEKCEKDPAKCDTAALQAALAKQQTAAAAADAAKKQREDIDGTTAAREKAEQDRLAAEAAANGAAGDDGDILNAASDADTTGVAEANAAPKRCEGANGIFEIIACKAITTLADLRTILYIISGFGLIAFAWSAIFNKISWKHFAQICIALFLLSMMGTFIGYFGYDGDYESLKFGEYLKDGYEKPDNTVHCTPTDDGCELPEVEVVGKASKKWSLKDLKGSIQSGISAVKKAHSAYQTAKSTVENVVSNAKTIGNAIKNGEGGLDGILNTMTTVAGATGNIMNSGQLLANNLAANIGGISEDVKLAGMSAEDRERRAQTQKRYAELKDQCTTGKCNADQMAEYEDLKQVVEGGGKISGKTGIQNWLDNDGKGGGATIMSGINKVGNITNNVSNAVTNTANAAQNGMSMGNDIGGGALGNILGAAMGAATGVGEGIGMVGDENFNFKSEAKKREEKAAAEEEAYKASDKYVVATSKDGKSEVRGDGSIKTTHDNGTVVVTSKDGTKTATTKNGSTVVQNTDGSKVVTNSNGTVTTYDKDGKVVNVDKSNTKVTHGGTASLADLAKKSSSGGGAGNNSASSANASGDNSSGDSNSADNKAKEDCEAKEGKYDASTKKCHECLSSDVKTKKCNKWAE